MALEQESVQFHVTTGEEEVITILEKYIDVAIEEYSCLLGPIPEEGIWISVARFPGKRVMDRLEKRFHDAGWKVGFDDKSCGHIFITAAPNKTDSSSSLFDGDKSSSF